MWPPHMTPQGAKSALVENQHTPIRQDRGESAVETLPDCEALEGDGCKIPATSSETSQVDFLSFYSQSWDT